MELNEIKDRYPTQKPVCFNYIRAREDILFLCEIVKRQEMQIYALEAQIKKAALAPER